MGSTPERDGMPWGKGRGGEGRGGKEGRGEERGGKEGEREEGRGGRKQRGEGKGGEGNNLYHCRKTLLPRLRDISSQHTSGRISEANITMYL